MAVQSAMAEAVAALLSSGTPGSFAQATRICAMGHKIELELVQSVKAAGPLMRTGYGGIVHANQLLVDDGFVGAPGYDMPVMPNYVGAAGGGDQATLMRDLTMMLQSHFKGEAERKRKGAEPKRYDVYRELNEALNAQKLLESTPDSTKKTELLGKLATQIEQLIDRVAQGDKSDESKTSVVPAELLRGHPPGASLEPGNAFDPGGPVLHREDRRERTPEGGAEDGDHQIAVG